MRKTVALTAFGITLACRLASPLPARAVDSDDIDELRQQLADAQDDVDDARDRLDELEDETDDD